MNNVKPHNDNQAIILNKILDERVRQDKKFGASPRGLDSNAWLIVLMEEVGEIARSIIESDSEEYEKELIQVAAVAIAALEDYYGGTQSKRLENVGCSIKYIGEQT